MRSSTPANPKRRRRPTSIAALAALCSLAAGVQVIASASASAMTGQGTTCLNMPPKGFTEPVPGMGWDPVGEFACKLDSGGAYYGGTDKKQTQTPTAPTPPICGRSCLPLEIGGGGSGSGSNPGRAPGSRPGAKPVVPKLPKEAKKPVKAEAKEAPSTRTLCRQMTRSLYEQSEDLQDYLLLAGKGARYYYHPPWPEGESVAGDSNGGVKPRALIQSDVERLADYIDDLLLAKADQPWSKPPSAIAGHPVLEKLASDYRETDCKQFRPPTSASRGD